MRKIQSILSMFEMPNKLFYHHQGMSSFIMPHTLKIVSYKFDGHRHHQGQNWGMGEGACVTQNRPKHIQHSFTGFEFQFKWKINDPHTTTKTKPIVARGMCARGDLLPGYPLSRTLDWEHPKSSPSSFIHTNKLKQEVAPDFNALSHYQLPFATITKQ